MRIFPGMTALLWVLGISFSISFLCSILEAVLLSVTRSFTALLQERGDPAGGRLARFQERIDEPIAAILTLNTVAHTVGASMGGALALEIWGDRWIAVFSGVLTLGILLFTEIVPKTIGATSWQRLAGPASLLLGGMVWVMRPVLLPLNAFSRWIAPAHGTSSTVTRAELEVLAEIGRREGTLDEEEWQVVSNVMNLDQVTLGEVMTPRTDMVAVPLTASVSDAKEVMLEEGHFRIPVYEGSVDRVVGILLARDLWRAESAGTTEIGGIVRPARFAPSTKPVEELIPEMRRLREKMVIVVDEFGGTAGLVTLEDLIEEIIGEIRDEHESDEPDDFQDLGGGALRIWGGVALRDVNERLGLELPEDDYDTVGGWMFGALNRIGVPGDIVPAPGGGRFTILSMDGRRVEFLRYEAPGSD